MPVRTATAQWQGDLPHGKGTMAFGNGAFEGTYSAGSRFEEAPGTNPEELIGAAHAGCFSMAFSLALSQAGFSAERIETTARVSIEKVGDGFSITKIALDCTAQVPGIDDATFQKVANDAKVGCPVSRALAAVPQITLNAKLA